MSLLRIVRAALSLALFLALATGARAEEPKLQWSARANSDFRTELRFNTAGTRLTLIAEDNITFETQTGTPVGPDLQGLRDLKQVSDDGHILLRLVGQGGFGADRRDTIVLSRIGEASSFFELGPEYFGDDPQVLTSRDGRFVLCTPSDTSLKTGPVLLIDTSSGTTTKLSLNEQAKPLALRQDGSALILSPGALLIIGADGTEIGRIPTPGWTEGGFGWISTTASRLSEDETRLAVQDTDAETGDSLVRVYDLEAMIIEATEVPLDL